MPHRITVAFQGKMPTMTDVPGPLARKMVFMTMPGDYVTDDFKGSGMAAGVTTHHSAEDPDKDWTYDGQQLFDGTVLGKKGTLVARESMRCVDGKIHNSTWTVVEGSGTGELKGIAGSGVFMLDNVTCDPANPEPVKGVLEFTFA